MATFLGQELCSGRAQRIRERHGRLDLDLWVWLKDYLFVSGRKLPDAYCLTCSKMTVFKTRECGSFWFITGRLQTLLLSAEVWSNVAKLSGSSSSVGMVRGRQCKKAGRQGGAWGNQWAEAKPLSARLHLSNWSSFSFLSLQQGLSEV